MKQTVYEGYGFVTSIFLLIINSKCLGKNLYFFVLYLIFLMGVKDIVVNYDLLEKSRSKVGQTDKRTFLDNLEK